MGEPLANYKNVMEAIRRMNTELGIGARHITISTSGIAPRIRALADEEMQIGLAISLHQTTNDKRSALMPINKKYPLEELLDACLYYTKTTKRRITFEWALIRNQTDTSETAHELGHLLTGMNCHVNVIPLNPTAGFGGKPTSKDGVSEFIRILETYGVPATPRTRRGIDIDAGCGQLKADLLRKRVQVGVVNPDVEVASIPGVIVGLTIDNNSSSSSGSNDSVTLGPTTSTSLLSTATSNKSSSSNVVKVNAVDGSTDEDTSFDQLLNSGVIWKPSVNNN